MNESMNIREIKTITKNLFDNKITYLNQLFCIYII